METVSSSSSTSCQAASLCLNFIGPTFPWTSPWVWTMGFGWTGAYLIYLSTAHLPEGGIPLPALLLNLTWEFLFSFVWPPSGGGIQLFGCRVWFLVDALILIRHLQHKKYNQDHIAMYTVLLAMTLGAFVTLFVMEFRDYNGVYSAFGINLWMSVLFVDQVLRQPPTRTVLLYAGLLRWLGSFAASMAFLNEWKQRHY